MPSTITFTGLNYTGSASTDDVLGARRAVFLENQRRASLTPPGTPLPFSTGAELKASVLVIYTERVTAEHLANIEAARSQGALSEHFTQAQLQEIAANLRARINAGELASQIVLDTAS